MRLPIIFALALASTAVAQDSPCHYANGSALREPTDQAPCNLDGVRTICCATNRTNPSGGSLEDGATQDKCLPNGLCRNDFYDPEADEDKRNGTTYWLDFCTNSDVTSTDCLDVCRNTRDVGGGTRLTPCDTENPANSTRWCCGDSNVCCTNNAGVVELPQKFVGRPIVSSSSSGSSPTSSSTSPPSASTSATQAAESSGLSTGAKAGIGVGVALGVIALLAAAFFARKAYAYKKRSQVPQSDRMPDPTPVPPPAPGYQPVAQSEKYANSGYAPSELPTQVVPPTELPATQPEAPQSPRELPGNGPIVR